MEAHPNQNEFSTIFVIGLILIAVLLTAAPGLFR